MLTYLEDEEMWVVTDRATGKERKRFFKKEDAKAYDEKLKRSKQAKGIKLLR